MLDDLPVEIELALDIVVGVGGKACRESAKEDRQDVSRERLGA